MRKYLTASLIACLASTSLIGCGDKSQEAQVSEQLEELLDEMSRLKYAEAPIAGNDLVYTLGTEVNGVKVPASTRPEAAYLDQALALLPKAKAIVSNGSELQQESAQAIIGSIKTDEAAYLIDDAERVFQQEAKEVVGLRGKVTVLREISSLNNSVAGDGSEVIETYRTGLETGRVELVGINAMQENADEAAGVATSASRDLADYSQKIEDLRDKVAEYEALELKLTGEARSAKSSAKFDKLDQATAAAKEAETAEMEAQKLQIDAWISERVANLAEFKRQRLDGKTDATTAGLIGKLEAFLAEAGEETNIPPSSDIYGNLAKMLEAAKQEPGDDTMKAGAFLLAMSDYATTAAPDLGQRQALVEAIDKRIINEIGVIGSLEMKIAQIKVERQRVAARLAEIEANRQAVLKELTDEFEASDKMIQAAGFDRMAQAIETLEEAQAAIQASGRNNNMELMSAYTLHARALQQQSVSARMYGATLASLATAGPELLGAAFHDTLNSRIKDMNDLIAAVTTTGVSELEAGAGGTADSLNTEGESSEAQAASGLLEVYDALIASIRGNSTGAPSTGGTDTPTPDPTPDTPGTADAAALVGNWKATVDGASMEMQFKADGSYVMKMGAPGGPSISFDGTYAVNGEELTVTIAGEGGDTAETGKFAVDGDTLTLFAPEDEDDDDIVMQRVTE